MHRSSSHRHSYGSAAQRHMGVCWIVEHCHPIPLPDKRVAISRLCRRGVLGGLALAPVIWQQSAQRSQAYDLEKAKAQ